MNELDRRTVLRGAGLVAGAGLMAACGGGEDDPATPGAAPTTPGTAPTTPAAAQPLARLADIAVGSSVSADAPTGEKVIITRTSQSAVVAFGAKCPHRGCTVAPGSDKLACPCHGSTFDTETGERLGGPAPTGLAPFPVKVVGGAVLPA